jgi:Tfp pilus assembly protein PilX
MRNWRTLLGNESGVALVLSLMMLLALTGMLLAFLSVSALEPQISKNMADTARARYLAEAGIEVGFNVLVNTADASSTFSTAITGANSSVPWVSLVSNGTLASVTSGGASAEATFAGTYNVVVRNDYQASDPNLTGSTNAGETLTADLNKIVIMRSTGSFNGATKTIEVVVRRAGLPPFPGAVNLPGVQSDTYINTGSFDIDGRDYGCSSNCDTSTNWTQTGASAAHPNKYGIASHSGTQSNINTAYETNIENAVSSDATKLADIKGRQQGGSISSYSTGTQTIAPDDSLDPSKLATYLDAVRNYAGTTILQSTQACRLVLTGTTTPTSTPTLGGLTSGGSACGTSQTLDLGSRSNPKLVYFKGDIDTSSNFTGLELNSGIKGAGILIVEDGDLKNLGNFTWDGVVIVTGSYVGAGFMNGSSTTIRGAMVANETQPGEANGYFEFYLGTTGTLSIHNSKQNIDMVQLSKGTHTITNWREL